MKKFIICICTLAVSLGAFAQTRTLEQMTEIAAQAMQSVKKQPVYGIGTPQKRPQLTVAMNSPELAVFNADGGGWVLVSADPRTNGSVLAYSREGSFKWDNAPENIRSVVNGYREQIRSLGTSFQADSTDVSDEGPGTPVVDALIRTRWDQDYPYNMLCPVDSVINERARVAMNCYTCCVATSMAQILYYWKSDKTSPNIRTNDVWPSQTVDFAQSHYEWENMIEEYRSDSVGFTIDENGVITSYEYLKNNFTEAQANAVAKLMYDCGAAVNVLYGLDASSAYSEFIPSAMITCFDYSTDARYLAKDGIEDIWDEIIKMELDAHRPVIYDGKDTSAGGHSFICDGYDDHDYFHFNFGWSGECDGYFKTAAINAGRYKFNYMQDMVIGLHPSGENDACIWQNGMCFNPTGGGLPKLVTATENGTLQHLITPEYMEIDGEKSLFTIASIAFYANRILTDVVLNGVAAVGDNAFCYCESIETVTLSDSTSFLDDFAFELCTSLKEVYAGRCMDSISYRAFADCHSLEKFTCMATVPPAIDSLAFESTPVESVTLVVPKGCASAYSVAPVWCDFGNIIEQESGTTAVSKAPAQAADPRMYDLNGRPVTDSHRGIVITDGKKRLQ